MPRAWSDGPDDLLEELSAWSRPGGPLGGRLIGRIHLPPSACPRGIGGPTPVVIRDGQVLDATPLAPTVSDLLERPDHAVAIDRADLRVVGTLEAIFAESHHSRRHTDKAHLLAPVDLQVVRACGVTFASSLLERVIEEGAHGDAAEARRLRDALTTAIGSDLSTVEPGSERASDLKAALMASGHWSPYLEVGIGPDPEIFTKAPVLSSVGTGQGVGVRSDSAWNNPEPEVVLVVDSGGGIIGATLGNDVNLRDLEGRSALLLGAAKDNNASCAIGPFIRLFDDSFDLETLMAGAVELEVAGRDGFATSGANRLAEISRSPESLVAAAIGRRHQYPDGLALFLGTMFVPTADRDGPGSGFRHRPGDRVTIREPHLGSLVGWVDTSEALPPWELGLRALMGNLAARGLLATEP